MALRISIIIFTWILFLSTVQGIEDGYNVTEKQFPWHARISVDNGKNCNGAVISEHYVLTSYQCLTGGRNFNVTLGCIHEGRPGCRIHSCTYFYAPPDAYTANSSDVLDYVALLELDNRMTYSDYIQPVQLPRQDRPRRIRYPYANATGYLRTDELIIVDYSFTNKWYLQWLPMRVINISECFDQIPASPFQKHIKRYVSYQYLICAQSEDEDGNKRGNLDTETSEPLVQNNTLIGIFRESIVSSLNNSISLFIQVHRFTPWITTTISMKGFSSTNNATQNEFPYHAYIGVNYFNDSNRNNCSGAVITPDYVLTATHCVQGGVSFRIKLGYRNPVIPNEDPSTYDHLTRNEAICSDFDGNYGVALIKLEIPIRFNSSIHPIRLASENENIFTLGFGYGIATFFYQLPISDRVDRLNVPRLLQWMPIRFAELTRECEHKYDRDYILDSLCGRRLLRLEGYDVNSCTDPGGPLVLNDRKTLVGIFVGSYNNRDSCKDGGKLSQFIDVRLHVEWIKRAMFQHYRTSEKNNTIISNRN